MRAAFYNGIDDTVLANAMCSLAGDICPRRRLRATRDAPDEARAHRRGDRGAAQLHAGVRGEGAKADRRRPANRGAARSRRATTYAPVVAGLSGAATASGAFPD